MKCNAVQGNTMQCKARQGKASGSRVGSDKVSQPRVVASQGAGQKIPWTKAPMPFFAELTKDPTLI